MIVSPFSRQIYERPSVIEAVAEVRFSLENNDPTIIGQLFSQISNKYPVSKPLNTVVFQHANKTEMPAFHAPQIQFWSENKKELIQLGPGLISSNILGYSKWEDFQEEIKRCVSIYLKLAQPNKLIRMGLRYINRFVLPTPLKLDQYLGFAFSIPDELKSFEAFQFNFVKPFAKIPGTKMRVVVGSAERKPEETGIPILFDIDFFSEQQHERPSLSQIMQFNELAHNEIEQMFESAITDETRTLMGLHK